MAFEFDYAAHLASQHERGTKAVITLSEQLTRLGYKTAAISYNGGNDSGDVEYLKVSREAIDLEQIGEHQIYVEDVPGEIIPHYAPTHTRGPDGNYVEIVLTPEAAATNKLGDLIWDIVSAKWGSFAGEYEVNGVCYVDLVGRKMLRCDSVGTTQYESENNWEVV